MYNDGNNQEIGITGNKEKTSANQNGIGIEAPGPIQLSYIRDVTGNRNGIFEYNFSFGAGAGGVFGAPRYHGVPFLKGLGGYRFVGKSASIYMMLEAEVSRFNAFLVITGTYYSISEMINTPVVYQEGFRYQSIGIKLGVGIDIFK